MLLFKDVESENEYGAAHDLSGMVVIMVDEDDRNESKTHLGLFCHF